MDNEPAQKARPDPLAEAARELMKEPWLDVAARRKLLGYIDPDRRADAHPVACDLCGWRGKRRKARSAPCPSCGSGKVQFR